MKKLSFNILLSFFVLLLSCSIIGPDNNDSEYPTTLNPITAVELQKLRNEFNELNNYEICFSLNEYGFTEYKICLDREILRVEVIDEEKMINMAKTSLFKNRKFTNVTDKSLFVVERSSGIRGCVHCDGSEGDIVHIGWSVIFANQVYQGLEVMETRISVRLDAEKVYNIGGNWYRDIYIPEKDAKSLEKTKESLIGLEITWHDSGGSPQVFVVIEESFCCSSRMVIVPHKNVNSIELRVTWEIPVGFEDEEWPDWNIYVDTNTGEVVRIEQLFDT